MNTVKHHSDSTYPVFSQAVNCLPRKNCKRMLCHRALYRDHCTGAWILRTTWYTAVGGQRPARNREETLH